MCSLTSLTIRRAPQIGDRIPDFSNVPLVSLALADCGLVGEFPSTLPTSLTSLSLCGNHLTGTISESAFARLPALTEFQFVRMMSPELFPAASV